MYGTTEESYRACSVRMTACGTVRRSISDTDRRFSSQRPLRCGAHPASYYSHYRGTKRPEREAGHPLPSVREVKNAWCCAVIPHRLRCHDMLYY